MKRRRFRALAAVAAGALLLGTALTVLITSPAKADSSLGSGFLFLGLTAESGGERAGKISVGCARAENVRRARP